MLRRHSQYNFAGSIHFITLVTRIRGRWFIVPEECRKILESFEHYRREHSAACYAYVLMPDHLHVLIVQEREENTIPKLVQDFKKHTSRNLKPNSYPNSPLWRIRYDDVPVPGRDAALTKAHYVHSNPVRAGLVEREQDYAFSSVRDYYEISNGPITIARI